ncbi:MAG: mechanosensitive ion channel family protein [Saprospiraceae bacterium]|nr:mechanosensitive ion channel family protein [Saprospiraceae bacterium]MCF8249743.1 mechanosensitive ion channel family protein [Saprospiraceae bacterium]MCF8279228.1 mechanosensitive ion channel family protein [Bacteroidales bacterium]MCF8312776.1 mechanosensitive ion channel family protein [Saprospiraceae bacterium]MCF8441223.1 mechanosensitive ion channel family protein [Saprospiraceae bacterium]
MEAQIQKILYDPLVGKLVTILIGIAIIWLIIKALQRSFFSKIKDNDNRYRAKKFSSFIGYFLTLVLVTVVFSDKLGNLTIALGVAGAGIAFALQEVIASFAGWLAIMFGGFYRSGDRVQLGGIKGDVMDIGVLRTTIMETGQWVDGDLYNGRIVLIANSFVFKEPVFNYSGDFPFLWDEIKIPIQYGSNYDIAKEIFLQVGKAVAGDLTEKSKEKWTVLQSQFRLETAQTEPMVSLVANDNWVEYTLRYVVGYKKRRITKSELFTQILKKVEATNGQVKFASATFHLVEAPEFKVKIEAQDKPA